MRYALAISLAVILILTGFLSDREPDTAAELYPLASAVSWVEGNNRALMPDLIGVGIRPSHVVKIGTSTVPKTPPVMMLHQGAVCRIYRDAVGRPLDGTDIPKLSWWINFTGVFPWALLLFAGLYSLAGLWLGDNGYQKMTAAWAALAGSLAFGWLGVASPYLAVTALSCWSVILVLEHLAKPSTGKLILAGILAGISGAGHPSGWVWVVWGMFVLFVSQAGEVKGKNPAISAITFGIGAAVSVVVVLVGNFLFFGTPLPVQMIDLQPVAMGTDRLIGLLWHDLVGWNGILWLAPLLIPGILALFKSEKTVPGGQTVQFLLGLALVVLFVWGVADDARLIGELDGIRAEFQVLPVELADGNISMVQLGQSSSGPDEQSAFYERLYERTDVFLWTGGRPAGLPVMLPVIVILAVAGWCTMGKSGWWGAWNWVGVRLGGLLGLVMSQAPYGALADYYLYLGLVVGADQAPISGHVPIVEAFLAVAIRLAEYWPSGVIRF